MNAWSHTTVLLNEAVDALVERVDWVLLDASGLDPVTGDPVWRTGDLQAVLRRLDRAGFTEVERQRNVILLRRA